MTRCDTLYRQGPFMFSFFRRGITAKIMLIFLGLALFAMVVTGFGTGGGGLGDIGGLGGSTVAKVDGEAITAKQVTDQAQQALERARQQQPELDMARFVSGGALEEITNQMIDLAATVSFARDQGLAVSKRMIDAEIARIPQFRNLAGEFDRAAFDELLRQEGITEQQLREDIAGRLLQRQLLLPMVSSAHVPQTIANQYASLLLEQRTGMIGVVPTQAMGPGREPTDQEVAAFYNENKARYTIPERRVLRYATFGPEQVAAQAKATDQEIQAAYRQNPAYQARETRRLSQVILPDEPAARAFAQKLAGGTGFAQAASQAGFAPADTSLGEQSKEAFTRLANAAVANAAFSAAEGATTAPIRSELGWHIVRVDDVTTEPARPLGEVRGEIAAQIEQQKTQNALTDFAAAIEEAIADGQSLEEVARARGLELRETPPITATGQAPGNAEWRPTAEIAPLLESGFQLEPGDEPVIETIAENERFALLSVGSVTQAAAPPLAQIAPRVKADLIGRRASERARAVAASIAAKINSGTPPAEAFREAEVELPAPQPVKAVRREIAREGGQVPPPLRMLFSLPKGKARLVPAPNGQGWFVVALQEVVPGDASKEPAIAEALRGEFANILGNEYGEQFTAAVRAEAEVKRNEDALQKLKSELTGGAAR